MKVLVRGQTYGSVHEAAQALGVSIYRVYSALDRGRMDTLGRGKSKPKPVMIEGISFPSMGAASVALGFSRSFVRDAMLSENPEKLQKIRIAAALYRFRQEWFGREGSINDFISMSPR